MRKVKLYHFQKIIYLHYFTVGKAFLRCKKEKNTEKKVDILKHDTNDPIYEKETDS